MIYYFRGDNMSNNVKKGRGYVYTIQYHIVWCTKYRAKVLVGEVEQTLKKLVHDVAKNNDFTIVSMETDVDHIHILIDCSPQHYIPNIMKYLKGRTARFIFLEHPELKKSLWGGHLWNPSYFVATVSENTREQIENYIQNQKTKTRTYTRKK